MLKFDPTFQKTSDVKIGRHMKDMKCIEVFVWHDYARIRHMYVCMYVCMYDGNDVLEIMVQCMHTSWCICHLAIGQVDRIS
jgi:hypothetical protein